MLRKILCFCAASTAGDVAIPTASAPARSHRFPTVIVSSLFQDSPRLTGVYLMIIDHKDWSTSAAIANNGEKAAGLITDRTAMWKEGAHDGRGFEKARITGGAAFAGHPARARPSANLRSDPRWRKCPPPGSDGSESGCKSRRQHDACSRGAEAFDRRRRVEFANRALN